MTINVCMVGSGMMGGWHTTALRGTDARLHTLVGRQPEPTRAFADTNGYGRWTTDFADAMADPSTDLVIVAGPSQTHAEMAMAALEAGKHVLVEIPLALTLTDCEALVATAARKGLRLGVVHPMRFRREHRALIERVRQGEEAIRLIHSRLFLHRLSNVGSTGLARSWTDNLLWHHGAHLVDVGLWLAGAGDPASVAVRRQASILPVPHALTGIPMELAAIIETGDQQAIVCTGSYHSKLRIFDVMVVTDRDSYHLDILTGTLTTGAGVAVIDGEEANNAQVARDFVSALAEGREPAVTGASVLPAMRLLDRFGQDAGGRP